MLNVEKFVDENDPEIICCTETRVTSQINDGEIQIDDYNVYRSDSQSRNSGGVVMYTKKKINVKLLHNEVFGYNNIMIVKVSNSNLNGIWMVVYRSPSESRKIFIEKLNNLCYEFIENNTNTYIVGDFNINMSRNNRDPFYKNKLKNLMNSHYMSQRVRKATNITERSATIIDLVFTNRNNKIIVNVVDEQIADHKTVYIYKEKRIVHKNIKTIKDRRLCTVKNLNEKIMNSNIESLREYDINSKAQCFDELVKNSVHSLIQIKEIDTNYCKKWYNDELKTLRKKRNDLQYVAQCTNDSVRWQEYRNARNEYNKKMNYYKNRDIHATLYKYKSDSKKLWKEMKRFMNNEEKPIEEVIFNGVSVNDSLEISNNFNEFFIQSVKQINESIKNVQYIQINLVNDVSWKKFNDYDKQMLLNVMKKMKKNVGIDDVTIQTISDIMETNCDIILSIINDSLSSGIFPKSYELSTVIPIRKIKNTVLSNEFRPINTIPVMNKILQTLVKYELETYMEQNDILNKYQSGFRQKHSCEAALNLIMASWKKEINDENVIIAVFIDLTRAFETIDKHILIKKLEEYGIEDTVLKWFKSYIFQHKQQVKFNNVYSEIKEVTIGLAQGTPLSSILFNVYINECFNVVNHCKLKLFADDAMLYISCKKDEVEDAYSKINHDLEQLINHFCMLKMKVNKLKTKAMEIANTFPQNNHMIKIDNETIEKVNEIKYLGIIIDKKLNFKSNLDYVLKKISKKTYFISRMRNKLTTDCKKLLYKSLVVPHIDYCSTILFMANNSEMDKLQKQQKKAMRSILKRDRMASTDQMLKDLDLLNVKQRVIYNTMKLIYKAEYGKLPSYLCELFIYVSNVQPYYLRSNNLFRLPNYLTPFCQNSVMYNGIKTYNDLKEKYTLNEKLSDFKKKLMEYTKRYV